MNNTKINKTKYSIECFFGGNLIFEPKIIIVSNSGKLKMKRKLEVGSNLQPPSYLRRFAKNLLEKKKKESYRQHMLKKETSLIDKK